LRCAVFVQVGYTDKLRIRELRGEPGEQRPHETHPDDTYANSIHDDNLLSNTIRRG
jgi:hypothetical protein